MTSIFDPTHPYYAVHKAFIEGSFANPTNPPQVESSIKGVEWYLTTSPAWCVNAQYRIKSRMLTRTVTYPEPMREALAEGTTFWYVLASHNGPDQRDWSDCVSYSQIFNHGMCFATFGDAEICFKALFGEQK